MFMKKLSWFLVAALMLSLVSVACTPASKSGTPDTSSSTPSTPGTPSTATGTKSLISPGLQYEVKLPIVGKPLKLTYFRNFSSKAAATMQSFAEMECYKEMEKLTGIQIEFIHPPLGKEKEAFNLLLASNDLPDLLSGDWPAISGGPEKYIKDGIIIRCNEYIEKYCPNYWSLINANPDYIKQLKTDSGTLYHFPKLMEDKKQQVWYGPMFRKDWLDKLGLKVPETLDDWEKTLIAFRDKDPNGNNLKDEKPFSGIGGGIGGYSYLHNNLAPAFGVLNTFYVAPGEKVAFGPIEPGFKDYLTMVGRWYKEKLLDPDILTNDDTAFQHNVTNSISGGYFALLEGHMAKFAPMGDKITPGFKLVGTQLPIGPSGKRYSNRPLNTYIQGGIAVTTANKHLEETFKWLDFRYTEKGILLLNYGIEGKSYTMKNGKPYYTAEVLANPKGLGTHEALIRYSPTVDMDALFQPLDYQNQLKTLPEVLNAINVWADADLSMVLPVVSFSAEEGKQIASIMNEVNTYVEEMTTKFTYGTESLDKWDAYVKQVKAMGIDKIIAVYQAAYNRYKVR